MTDTLIHRGPEGEAFWISPSHQAGFGHRRLCIIDLTEAGRQPMHYEERYTIVYNGEIYNYRELRADLEKQGYRFKSRTDTEVLIAAYACYQEQCLQYLDGMFAFAIWDEEEQHLFAARDRFGEKPFYYFQQAGELVFASEIKALWAAGMEKRFDEKMMLNFLTLGWTEHPFDNTRTCYRNIQSLAPAHYMIARPGERIIMKRYWSLIKHPAKSIAPADAINTFKELFYTSVNRRLRSDVPIGTSLSGGLDSSSVIAAAGNFRNAVYTHKSFSAIFPGYLKDESAYINRVTDTFQLQGFTVTPSAEELVKDMKKLIYFHDQPFHSSAIYAQYKVYELAKEHQVTVLLDGQGADEMLSGYMKYIHWYLQELISSFRISTYRKEKKGLEENGIPFHFGMKNMIAANLPSLTARQLRTKAIQSQLHHPDIHPQYLQTFHDPAMIYKPVIRKLNDILHYHTSRFGLQELLRYADINAMAHSREVRLPFLSHELVQFAFNLPASMKIHDGWTKWILRKAMEPVLPADITWRKDKIGYEPPQQEWMHNHSLQEMIHESKRTLVKNKILKEDVLQKKIQPREAIAAENFDWRYLVAGLLSE